VLRRRGERLERIEHAVDAMAVEVERLGEGQRFTTQLLAGRAGETSVQPGGASPPYRPPS
jgi:aspartate 1-decarboxylase